MSALKWLRAVGTGIGVIADMVKGARQARKLDNIERLEKLGDANRRDAEARRRELREKKQ